MIGTAPNHHRGRRRRDRGQRHPEEGRRHHPRRPRRRCGCPRKVIAVSAPSTSSPARRPRAVVGPTIRRRTARRVAAPPVLGASSRARPGSESCPVVASGGSSAPPSRSLRPPLPPHHLTPPVPLTPSVRGWPRRVWWVQEGCGRRRIPAAAKANPGATGREATAGAVLRAGPCLARPRRHPLRTNAPRSGARGRPLELRPSGRGHRERRRRPTLTPARTRLWWCPRTRSFLCARLR